MSRPGLHGSLMPLALVVAFGGGLCPPAFAGVAESLREGCRMLAGGRWESATVAFRRAAEQDNQCAEAHVGEGAAQLLAGFDAAGADCFTKALTLDPQLGVAHLGRGTVAYLQQRLPEAWGSYQRALTAGVNDQGPVRAAAAQVACLLGQYEAAETVAREALALSPGSELALQVLAAAQFARGHAAEAIKSLSAERSSRLGREQGIVAQSPLFAPAARYYLDHNLAETRRAGAPRRPSRRPPSVAVAPETPGVLGRGDSTFRIDWPRPGAQANGRVEVTITATPEAQVLYVAVLVDEQFAGMSNASPFRVWVDTKLSRDGLREIRVDGYGADGTIARTASVLVNVTNGQRTLSEEELRVRASVATFLENYVILRANPLLRAQLVGRALEALGRPQEALDAYEYAFSYEPSLPGVRDDLLLCYQKLGITDVPDSHEIHALPPGNHVALTFDDGPHPVLTPWILDLLDRHQAKATFLLVGRQAEMYPELTREIARRGHEIGCHSYTHANLKQVSALGVERELVMCRLMLRRAAGEFVTLFRPPGGNYDPQVREAVAATGYRVVFWTENITSYPGQSGPEILPRMLNRIGSNGIVLLHNGYDETREVLPLLLPALSQRGLKMDTVSALGGHRTTRLQELSLYPVDWKL